MTGRSPYRSVPPNRWPNLYATAARIDATLAGLGGTMFLLASRGLLWAAQAAADARLVRAEERAAVAKARADKRLEQAEARTEKRAKSRWAKSLERWDDAQMEANNRLFGGEPWD